MKAAARRRPDPSDKRLVDLLSWTVIPALPGTRIEWKADWCIDGSIPVHAWLITVDVVGQRNGKNDTSCVIGEPMVLNANDELQIARLADLDGKSGAVIDPTP